jgi:tetratricopeptide (TPR) repeat protein
VTLPKRLPRPGEVIGGLLLEEELGRGGAGAVFRARAPNGSAVAIKIVLRDLDEGTTRERFIREAEVGRELRHPHVVAYLGSGVEQGVGYIVMELLEGALPIDSYVEQKQLSPEQRVRLMIQVSEGVQAAHDAGLVHRDLKPDNVIVTAAGQPKVVDFGLARHLDRDRLTRSGTTMGTLHFMAPEQARGQTAHASAQTDVYALGALLYHLLVGEPPFNGSTAIEILRHILETEVPALPPELAEYEPVIQMALAKKLEERYPSASALARDLVATTSGSRTTAASQLGDVRRRRRRGVVLLLAFLALMGAGAVWLSSRGAGAAQAKADLDTWRRDLAALVRSEKTLRADAEAIGALSERCRALPPHLTPAEDVQQAEHLGALLALAQGGESATPPEDTGEALALALRGAILAETGDAGEATLLLARALRRGVRPADLRRWRAVAAGRGPLTASRAQTALDDVASWSAAGGDRSPRLEAVKARALVATQELEAARELLSKLSDPPALLRWELALAELAQRVPTRASAARESMTDLPDPLPTALSARARELAGQTLVAVERSLRDENMLAAADWLRVLGSLRSVAKPLPGPLIARLISNISGVHRKVEIELALALADVAPENLNVHRAMTGIAAQLSRAGQRRLLPVIRRAVRLEPRPGGKQIHEIRLAYVLSAFTDLTPEEGRELSALLDRVLSAVEDPMLHAALLSSRARFERSQGRLDNASRDLEEALELDPSFNSAIFQLVMLRNEQQRGRDVVGAGLRFLKANATNTDRRRQVMKIVWRWREANPAEVAEALADYAAVVDEPGSWWLRLAVLQVAAAEPAALETCRRGLKLVTKLTPAGRKYVAAALAKGDPKPLQELVAELDK